MLVSLVLPSRTTDAYPRNNAVIRSGQIITTSAEVTLNGGLIRELPQNPLNSGLGIIVIWPVRSSFGGSMLGQKHAHLLEEGSA